MSGWTVSSGNPNIFQNNWPYHFGLCQAAGGNAPFQQEIMLRAEMVIVNGTQLTQVLSLSSMLPGTFFVDDPHATVYIYPPSGTAMSTATAEVANRPHLLQDDGQSYVAFRGLTFQYANCEPHFTLGGTAAWLGGQGKGFPANVPRHRLAAPGSRDV